MDLTSLRNILKDNGIVGCGGAGFPTYAKINDGIDTIIMNCCECEPLLRLHRQLLERHTEEILKTFELLRQTLGAKHAVIGIKRTYVNTIDSLNNYIGNYKNLSIKLVEPVYPAGDEVVLIYEVTGKVVHPGGLPIECGVAVFNVETVYNLYKATNNQPVTSKLVTVACEVKTPMTYRVPLGMKLEEVVALSGGETAKDPVYLVGGPMMGSIMPKNATVTKTTNAILVLDRSHYVIKRKTSNNKVNLKRASASCCQCNMCTDLCPRHLLGHPIDPSKFMRATTCRDIQDTSAYVNTLYCSSCGLCEMYSCTQGLSPRTLIGEMKGALRRAGIKPSNTVQQAPVNVNRNYRRAPVKRLEARLDLTKYETKAPLTADYITCNTVRENLQEHIGAPSVPVIKVGDIVKHEDLIAKAGEGLSVGLHASISGIVTEITDKYIEIKKVTDK